jgi:hypothetical protein
MLLNLVILCSLILIANALKIGNSTTVEKRSCTSRPAQHCASQGWCIEFFTGDCFTGLVASPYGSKDYTCVTESAILNNKIGSMIVGLSECDNAVVKWYAYEGCSSTYYLGENTLTANSNYFYDQLGTTAQGVGYFSISLSSSGIC